MQQKEVELTLCQPSYQTCGSSYAERFEGLKMYAHIPTMQRVHLTLVPAPKGPHSSNITYSETFPAIITHLNVANSLNSGTESCDNHDITAYPPQLRFMKYVGTMHRSSYLQETSKMKFIS